MRQRSGEEMGLSSLIYEKGKKMNLFRKIQFLFFVAVFFTQVAQANSLQMRWAVFPREKMVYDMKTKRFWDQGFVANKTYEEAINHCSASTSGGHKWMIPSEEDLFSLVDRSKSAPPFIFSQFEIGQENKFWSSTSADFSHKWLVDFKEGISVRGSIQELYSVRCVSSRNS